MALNIMLEVLQGSKRVGRTNGYTIIFSTKIILPGLVLDALQLIHIKRLGLVLATLLKNISVDSLYLSDRKKKNHTKALGVTFSYHLYFSFALLSIKIDDHYDLKGLAFELYRFENTL